MGYTCDSGDGNAAVVVIQQLTGEAESLAWCPICWPQFIATAYAEQFPEGEPIPLTPTASDPCPVCGEQVPLDQVTDHVDRHVALGEISNTEPDPEAPQGPATAPQDDTEGGDTEGATPAGLPSHAPA